MRVSARTERWIFVVPRASRAGPPRARPLLSLAYLTAVVDRDGNVVVENGADGGKKEGGKR